MSGGDLVVGLLAPKLLDEAYARITSASIFDQFLEETGKWAGALPEEMQVQPEAIIDRLFPKDLTPENAPARSALLAKLSEKVVPETQTFLEGLEEAVAEARADLGDDAADFFRSGDTECRPFLADLSKCLQEVAVDDQTMFRRTIFSFQQSWRSQASDLIAKNECLARELGMTTAAVEAFFRELGDDPVGESADLPGRLIEHARAFREAKVRLEPYEDTSGEVEEARQRASAQVDAGMARDAAATLSGVARKATERARTLRETTRKREEEAADLHVDAAVVLRLAFDFPASAREYLQAAQVLEAADRLRAASMRDQAGKAYFEGSLHSEALECFSSAATAFGEVLGEEDVQTLKARANAGASSYGTGDVEAAQKELLKVAELLGDRPEALPVLANIARIASDNGMVQPALALYERLVSIETRLYGPTAWSTLEAEAGRAAALRFIRPVQAEKAERRLVEVFEREYGVDHMRTLIAKMAFGTTLYAAGQFQEAAGLYRAVAEARERTLGLENPDTLRTMANLSVTLRELEQDEEAADLEDRVLAGRLRLLGPEHPETLLARAHCALGRVKPGDLEDVCNELEDILTRMEKRLGRGHPEVLNALVNLGLRLEKGGRVEDGLAKIRDAIARGQTSLSPIHPMMLHAIRAWVMMSGRSDKADPQELESLLRDVLRAYEARSEKPDFEAARTAETLGRFLANRRRFSEARLMIEMALSNYEERFPDDHKYTRSALEALEICFRGEARYGQAGLIRQMQNLRFHLTDR